MVQVVYISTATRLFSKDELAQLLSQSRTNNQAGEVTGLLLYKGGNFMQVLEGEETKVTVLFERIGRDTRHHSVTTLLRSQIEQRAFPDWSMGFRDLNDASLRTLPGYSEFLNVPLTPELSASRCQKLLTVFRTRM